MSSIPVTSASCTAISGAPRVPRPVSRIHGWIRVACPLPPVTCVSLCPSFGVPPVFPVLTAVCALSSCPMDSAASVSGRGHHCPCTGPCSDPVLRLRGGGCRGAGGSHSVCPAPVSPLLAGSGYFLVSCSEMPGAVGRSPLLPGPRGPAWHGGHFCHHWELVGQCW